MTLSPNLQGAVYMMGSMAAFTFNDACVKLLAPEMPLFQIIFLRGVLTSVLLVGLAYAMGLRSLRIPRGDRWLVVGRTLAELGGMVSFLTALLHMPLANISAFLMSLPLTVSLAAALFLGEPVGWKRLMAILVGMIGVMMIVQPGTAGFNSYSLLVLLAVALFTARDILTRRLSDAVPSLAVAVITAVSVAGFGGLMMIPQDWAAVSSGGATLVALAAVFIIAGYLLSIMVMRVGEVSFVAPFRYTMLIWALALGWYLFGDWPDSLTLAGAAVVVATGIFTIYRESRVRVANG
jgi:drug/metabolite transporter (DMT)-like permease